MNKEESRLNEAGAFISEEIFKMDIENGNYIVLRVTDPICHKLNEKIIKEKFKEESYKIIPMLSSLIKRNFLMPDFICKNKINNEIFFVEFKNWFKSEFKLDNIKQKSTLKEINKLGFKALAINKDYDIKQYLDQRYVEKLLKIKRKYGGLKLIDKYYLERLVPDLINKKGIYL